MTDGASAVLLGTEAWARERNLPVLAYLSYGKVAAVDYIEKKEGLLMARVRGSADVERRQIDAAGLRFL